MKVIVADSNELIRIGLRTILGKMLDKAEIKEAKSSDHLFKLIAEEIPNVVVIDYTADQFSIDTLQKITQKYSSVKFVAITFDQSGQTIRNALRAGVMSYIKKDCEVQEIVDAVKETNRGQQFFCGKILETIKEESINVEDVGASPLNCAPISLSAREIEVIKLIADGYTNKQISTKLFLSNHTITTHRKNIMQKLGVNNTAGIVMYAVKSNFVNANKYLFSSDNE